MAFLINSKSTWCFHAFEPCSKTEINRNDQLLNAKCPSCFASFDSHLLTHLDCLEWCKRKIYCNKFIIINLYGLSKLKSQRKKKKKNLLRSFQRKRDPFCYAHRILYMKKLLIQIKEDEWRAKDRKKYVGPRIDVKKKNKNHFFPFPTNHCCEDKQVNRTLMTLEDELIQKKTSENK